jgi:hypothetical protein
MAPSVPTRRYPTTPVIYEGEIFKNVGKYARGAVLFAFEQIGGPQGLADWAQDNPDDFYTKLFPKIIARESEVHHTRSVDDLMDAIDGDYTTAAPEEEIPQELDFDRLAYAGSVVFDDYDEPGRADFDIDDFVEFEE